MTESTISCVLFLFWTISQGSCDQSGLSELFTDRHVTLTSVPRYMVIRDGIDQVRFQCYVDGLPARKEETMWMRNNRIVQCNYVNRVFACYNIIIITDVTLEDAGEYTCMTVGGNARSSFCTANIYVPAFFTNPETEFLSVSADDGINLSSLVSNLSYPPPAYVLWRKGAQYIAEGPVLHLGEMDENTTGMYETVIFNGYGEPAIKSYNVTLSETNTEVHKQNKLLPTLEDDISAISMSTRFGVKDVEFQTVPRSGVNKCITAFQYVVFVTLLIVLLSI